MAEALPTLNATLNATSTVLLLSAFVAIKRRDIVWHKRLMLSAVCTSALFLVFYLIRFALTGVHRFPDVGLWKTVYLCILGTHTLLAATVLPLVLRTVWLGLRRDDARHRKIARYAWPVWLYVSVTGVVVYLMLYHLAPRLV